MVRDAVVNLDVLGLSDSGNEIVTMQRRKRANVNRRAFAFPRSDQKVQGFMQWLSNEVRKGVLEANIVDGQLYPVGNEPWTNVYISSAYQKGIQRGMSESKKAGLPTPMRVDQNTIETRFFQPFHADRVGLLYSRTFEELKGVTDTMGQQIRRVLSEGIAEGRGPRDVARGLNNRVRSVGINRARTIARTEIVRAHHHATIREYEAAGAAGVTVRAEWLTAGDDRVCEECAALEGRVFSMDEILGMIPRHPNCRCVALPVTEDTEE